MSTKNTTTTTNAYNPSSMTSYNSFQPQLASYWMQALQNPFGTSQFQNQLTQSMSMNNQLRQRSMANSLQNLKAGGGILSNAPGFATAMINRNAIAGNLMQGNTFNNAVNTALNTRNSAAMSMAAYQPLQTGQKSVQQTSGLGTWLPQVASMAMNAVMPGLGSMMGGGSFSGGYQGGGNPYSTLYNAQHAAPPPSAPSAAGTMNPYIPYE